MDVTMWEFGRAAAAAIVGLSEKDVAGFQISEAGAGRVPLFPSKKVGTGRGISFHLADLMKLAAAGRMVDDGFSVKVVTRALSSFTLFGVFLNNGAGVTTDVPGVFALTRGPSGDWQAVDHADAASAYHLRTWALFDRIWPNFYSAILADTNYRSVDGPTRERKLDEFYERIEALRAARWGEDE